MSSILIQKNILLENSLNFARFKCKIVLKKNLVYNTLLSVSQVLFPLIIFPFAFKVLEPAGIGLLSFTENLTQYLISLAALGIPIYGIREVAKCKQDKEKLSNLFSSLFFIQCLLTIIIILIYLFLIQHVERLSKDKFIYYISSIIILINVFTIEWFLQGLEKFKLIAIRTIIIRSLFIILILLFVKSKNDLLVYYGLILLTTFLNAAVNFSQALMYLTIKVRIKETLQHVKPLLFIFITTLAVNVYIVLDTVILGFLSPNNESVGYYTTALRICKIPLAFMTALSMVLIPRISSFYATGDLNRVHDLIQKSFSYIILIALPISIGLFLLAPDIIFLLANKNYEPSITVVRLLSLLTLIIGLNNLFGMQILTTLGKEKVTMYIVAVGMMVSVLCNLSLVPIFSYIGTTISTLLAEIFVTVATGYFALYYFKFRFPWIIIIQSLIACLSFVPLYYFTAIISQNPLFRVLFMIVIGGTIYFLLMLFLFKNRFLISYKKTIHSKLSLR